jgi:nickel superoxide dismutase
MRHLDEGGKNMKIKCLSLLMSALLIALWSGRLSAHCEIPCGIYDDQLRVHMIAEHLVTIDKSMVQIKELGKKKSINYNQLIRWTNNKEKHANEIQQIVCQYFLTQRIKPETKKYSEKLKVLHKMLIHAMKCKQTTDLSHVTKLRSLLKDFEILYFGDAHK